MKKFLQWLLLAAALSWASTSSAARADDGETTCYVQSISAVVPKYNFNVTWSKSYNTAAVGETIGQSSVNLWVNCGPSGREDRSQSWLYQINAPLSPNATRDDDCKTGDDNVAVRYKDPATGDAFNLRCGIPQTLVSVPLSSLDQSSGSTDFTITLNVEYVRVGQKMLAAGEYSLGTMPGTFTRGLSGHSQHAYDSIFTIVTPMVVTTVCSRINIDQQVDFGRLDLSVRVKKSFKITFQYCDLSYEVLDRVSFRLVGGRPGTANLPLSSGPGIAQGVDIHISPHYGSFTFGEPYHPSADKWSKTDAEYSFTVWLEENGDPVKPGRIDAVMTVEVETP